MLAKIVSASIRMRFVMIALLVVLPLVGFPASLLPDPRDPVPEAVSPVQETVEDGEARPKRKGWWALGR